MVHFIRVLVAAALAASLGACNEGLPVVGTDKHLPPAFEDVGADPHPPTLTLLGIGLQPVGGDPDNPPTVAYVPPEAGIVLRPFQENARTLALRVAYADAGADLAAITVRDLDGAISGDLTLPDVPETSGTIEGTIDAPTSSMPGPHRLEIWAQDDNESRSAKTTFTVTVEIF